MTTTPEQRAKTNARRRNRQKLLIKEYLEIHDHPTCKCGCGTKVNFDLYGKPYLYANGHRGSATTAKMTKARWGDRVPADKFRKIVKDTLEKRNWTLKELAEAGSVEYKDLRRAYYGKASSISKPWATRFLRSLAGLPVVPTEQQAAAFEASIRKENQFDGGIRSLIVNREKRLAGQR